MTGINLFDYFYDLVKQIPKGRVSTYGDLARALGDIRAARACGYMLSLNPDPDQIPCYRVVYSDSRVGNYSHPLGRSEKIRRLTSDGIPISNEKITDLEKFKFNDFNTDYPLKRLQEEQIRLARTVRNDLPFDHESMCAVDVSYFERFGVGVAVIVENGTKKFRISVQRTNFPYIPGYLSYREFPFIKELCKNFGGIALIDGNGLLHYRKMGLATHAGLHLNIPTIGVAKSVLTGRIENDYVMVDGEKLAYVMGKHEIISPGYGVTLEGSIRFIVKNFGKRYPSILKEAHTISKKAAQIIWKGGINKS